MLCSVAGSKHLSPVGGCAIPLIDVCVHNALVD